MQFADFAGHELFRRCVQCPEETPSCPTCSADETCTLIAASCTSCASTVCSKPDSSTTHKHSTPAGAIAGGVIGGVAVVAILVYLVWRFLIRDRRKEWDQQTTWTEDAFEKRDQYGLNPDARNSRTRSVHSVASTVLTRASNVIQIAYIPGVTNRSPPDTPGLLVPPVPPLPLATVNSNVSSPSYEPDQHFFMPGDIRDSTWSGYSDMTRASISPSLARSSVATTIYRDNAIVSPMPAQQALRGRAAVVSVKSGATTPTDGSDGTPTPPMPANAASIANSGSSIVARNLVPKPIQIKKAGKSNMVPTFANLSKAKGSQIQFPKSKTSIIEEGSSEDDERTARRQSVRSSKAGPASNQVIAPEDSTVEAASSSTGRDSSAGANHRHKKSGSLQFMIEEALNRAAKEPRHGGLGSVSETRKQDGGPFSDANEVKENY